MHMMFYESNFNQDISNWKPYKLINMTRIFELSQVPIAYWSEYEDKATRKNAIKNYLLKNKLDNDLNINNNIYKKVKL